MKVAFVLYEMSYNSYDHGIVYGEEIDARGMQKAFLKRKDIEVCDLMTINIIRYRQSKGEVLDYDLIIHFNTSTLLIENAINVLFFQQYYEFEKHDLHKYGEIYDFIITPSPIVTDDTSIFYFPLAVDPEYYYPQKCDQRFKCDIAFVGNRKMRSLESYNRYLLPATKYELKIYGAEWDVEGFEAYQDFYQGLLPYDDATKLYSSAKVSLSIHGSWYINKFQLVTTRAFHSIACGEVVLSDKFDEIVNLLPEGKGILYTEGFSDSDEKLKYLLENEAEVNQIREAGRKWVLENHTWDVRIQTILDKIK